MLELFLVQQQRSVQEPSRKLLLPSNYFCPCNQAPESRIHVLKREKNCVDEENVLQVAVSGHEKAEHFGAPKISPLTVGGDARDD